MYRPTALSLLATAFFVSSVLSAQNVPHLERRGQATQLIVDGKPYLMLAGELHNSSSSSLDYMKASWPQLSSLGLNTVLTPVSWELVEPVEGKYDFTLVDGLIEQARAQHMHIVFLWLAAWKNGLSGYPPAWVKEDLKRFPRAMLAASPNYDEVEPGRLTNILSTLSPGLVQADSRAFRALMEHIRSIDGEKHTVLMMQVENEVGVLGDSRDHSAVANRAFAGAVPEQLMRYLTAHRDSLNSDLRTLWERNGAKSNGTWTEIFGDTTRTDEIFMAWNYARYIQTVAAAGKSEYAIPMFVNCWLGSTNPPGDYPSGGPLTRVLDVWRAAGSSLDFYTPDLYSADFEGWATRYHQPNNPLFLAETSAGPVAAGNVFYAFGEQAALGFSPFGIDAGTHGEPPRPTDPALKGREELSASYHALQAIMPQLIAAQESGDVRGFLLTKSHPAVDLVLHGLTLHVSLDDLFGNRAESGFGLILQDGPNSFLGVGKGFHVAFSPRDAYAPAVGIASIVEGSFENGTWIPGRHLNGDENDQGNYWRFDQYGLHTERVTIYTSK
jgi:beta-galactosidase GanA